MSSSTSPPGVVRLAIIATTSCVLAIPWTHALSTVFCGAIGAEDPSAVILSYAAICTALFVTAFCRQRSSWSAAGIAGLAAGGWVSATASGPWTGLVLVPVAFGCAAVSEILVKYLPARIDRVFFTNRLRSLVWGVLAVVTIVQVGRLATWMSDPSSDWFLSTRHPFWAKHECLPAYVYGAELGLSGEPNVYDANHYPALNPSAEPKSRFAGMTIEDPFQYLPQFLLWPAAATSVAGSYDTIRLLWFSSQITLFLAVAVGVALWIGGRAGRVALWLLPLALTAFPTLHDLQYGQFHLAAVVLAIAAMLAFEKNRSMLGGALLSVAVLSKIFPGILLLPMIAQRRWKDIGFTALFGVLLTVATLAVLGPDPFVAFSEYHLPRLQDGKAFAFGEAWPDLRDFIIADNQGVYGFVLKLKEIGVPLMSTSLAVWTNRVYAIVLALMTVLLARRMTSYGREQKAITWLALVGAASLMSTGAFGDYVPVTATWLLTLLAYRMSKPRVFAALAPVWFFQYTLLGTTPIGEWFAPGVMIPLSAIAFAMLLGLFLHALRIASFPRRSTEPGPAVTLRPAVSPG